MYLLHVFVSYSINQDNSTFCCMLKYLISYVQLCRRIGDLSKEDSSLDFLENLTSLSMLYDALYALNLFYFSAIYILLQNVSGLIFSKFL